MRRPAIRRTIVGLTAACAVAAAAAVTVVVTHTASAATVQPPMVIGENFPDPDVSLFDGVYYAYSTNTGRGNVPVATASTPTGPWTFHPDAMPTIGSWASTGMTWAPDVSRRADGTYLLYYTARSVSAGRQCIGAAVASSPLGPFTGVGNAPIVCDAAEGGEIDPSSYVENGTRYLVYKNDGNAIGATTTLWLQQMAADGVTKQGSRFALLHNDRSEENGVIEAPVLVKRPSQYVLFYSQGSYAGDGYATSYAVSPTLTGAYSKAYRPLLTTASMNSAVRGPGGQDIIDNQSRIVFHGWTNNYTTRSMYVADLGWSGDFPVVRGSRVRYEAENGTLNDATVRSSAPNASQGAVVGKIDNADSWAQLGVYAPTAGVYTVSVAYAAGYGAAQHTLTVNGGSQTVVNYPNIGWDTYQQVAVDVTLNAGGNTLRFTHLTGFAELDYIEVA
jgi:arabinan endo-1,5-alpha-L-arabinosidase